MGDLRGNHIVREAIILLSQAWYPEYGLFTEITVVISTDAEATNAGVTCL